MMASESQVPAGAVLAHTQWGEPKDNTAMVSVLGAQPAPFGLPYQPTNAEREAKAKRDADRSKKCRAKDDTCNGWRIRDSDFCAAHAGVLHP